MIKDGRTVVIGGLFRELTTAGRGQVPVLGNIPILGVPFRRTNEFVTGCRADPGLKAGLADDLACKVVPGALSAIRAVNDSSCTRPAKLNNRIGQIDTVGRGAALVVDHVNLRAAGRELQDCIREALASWSKEP